MRGIVHAAAAPWRPDGRSRGRYPTATLGVAPAATCADRTRSRHGRTQPISQFRRAVPAAAPRAGPVSRRARCARRPGGDRVAARRRGFDPGHAAAPGQGSGSARTTARHAGDPASVSAARLRAVLHHGRAAAAQTLAPVEELLADKPTGPVGREQVLDCASRAPSCCRNANAPSAVVFASPTGYTPEARSLVNRPTRRR